jgi:hypothetical protein
VVAVVAALMAAVMAAPPPGFGSQPGPRRGSNGPPGGSSAWPIPHGSPKPLMKRLVLVGVFVALLVAIVAIAATWSKVTPVNPAVSPDTSATPNPTSQRK